jgi:hypothetical protein
MTPAERRQSEHPRREAQAPHRQAGSGTRRRRDQQASQDAPPDGRHDEGDGQALKKQAEAAGMKIPGGMPGLGGGGLPGGLPGLGAAPRLPGLGGLPGLPKGPKK